MRRQRQRRPHSLVLDDRVALDGVVRLRSLLGTQRLRGDDLRHGARGVQGAAQRRRGGDGAAGGQGRTGEAREEHGGAGGGGVWGRRERGERERRRQARGGATAAPPRGVAQAGAPPRRRRWRRSSAKAGVPPPPRAAPACEKAQARGTRRGSDAGTPALDMGLEALPLAPAATKSIRHTGCHYGLVFGQAGG